MTRSLRAGIVALVAWFSGNSVLLAQPPRHVLSGVAGVSSDRADTDVTLGASLVIDVHEQIAIAGEGAVFRRGTGAEAIGLTASILIDLLPVHTAASPYVAVGAGLYRIGFDLDTARFLGPTAAQFPAGTRLCPAPGREFGSGTGPGFGPGTGTCTATGGFWGVGAIPTYYARRLGSLTFPRDAQWGTRHFTDPALSVGGGVRFDVNDRLTLRPDARALVVFNDRVTHTIAVLTMHVGFRF